MNCQDISRIVDTGHTSNLGAAERSAAEAHARCCRDCAAIWGVQSRLAAVRVPATPPQVAARLRILAGLPERPSGGRFYRRLMVIGGVAVMAAAAASLAIRLAGRPATQPVEIAAVTPAVDAAPVQLATPATVPPTPAPAVTPPGSEPPTAQPAPLLPRPNLGSQLSATGMSAEFVDQALEKAAERHPELVEGPEVEGTFVVGVALNMDGSVFTSAVRLAPPGGVSAASLEIDALTPGEGGMSAWSRPKLTRLRGDRMLRADAVLTVRRIPAGFDFSRSRARLLQILGDRYAYLMAPVTDGALNRLEVFLSEDGRILREHVDTVRAGDSGTNVTEDPAELARFAAGIAARLGVDERQIGAVGLTAVQGAVRPVWNPAGGPPSMPNPPRMMVAYAWERRAGESAPTLAGNAPAQGINQVAALAVAERYVPDAFTARDPAAGVPVVLLTAKGEFIRAGNLPPGTAPIALLKTLSEQPPVDLATKVKLTNGAGVSAEVYFAWERPGAGRP